MTYCEDNDEYFEKYKYDEKGREIYFENSLVTCEKYEYDKM